MQLQLVFHDAQYTVTSNVPLFEHTVWCNRNTPLYVLRTLFGLKCNFYTLFKCAHLCILHFVYNFCAVAKAIHTLIVRHPALIMDCIQ